ncbi:MAG: class I SAM-dependent methyltransferase [Gammaproteobacteria bacterium]|jgi:SAM-dependent methyltransferase|nr:class I SAM-dependent methyltransferase [Gammaproteobacteria bacterium]MBT7370072.1 class I SAM-dependent methyltransferase [Gammaproteobacteria bacterium]
MGNKEQGEFWNGRMGSAWVSVEDYIDRMLEPISSEGIRLAAAKAGERVLDIGCGCGTTSLQLAADGAAVWGVDISENMIARANEKDPGSAAVRFSVADAAVQKYTPDHDCAFSRFGIMFFDDPVVAFQNIRSGLKSDGRLVFLCWQAPANNPWIAIAGQAVQPFMTEGAPQPGPTDPGPFAFADLDYTRKILVEGGFTDINIDPVEREIALGSDLDELMEFQSRVGPLSGLLDTLDENTAQKARQAVMDAFSQHLSDDGIVASAAAWLVSARNSG